MTRSQQAEVDPMTNQRFGRVERKLISPSNDAGRSPDRFTGVDPRLQDVARQGERGGRPSDNR